MTAKTLTRADLAEAVYKLGVANRRTDPLEMISREESAELVETVLQYVSDALVEGDGVKISSFGAFEVREKASRIGRNPKTGEEAMITPRRVLSFRASHVLKERINIVDEEGRAVTDAIDEAEQNHSAGLMREQRRAGGQ